MQINDETFIATSIYQPNFAGMAVQLVDDSKIEAI